MSVWLEGRAKVCTLADLKFVRSNAFSTFVATYGESFGITVFEYRKSDDGEAEFVVVDVAVDRPQRPVHDIRNNERIAVGFARQETLPIIFALRPDFPFTPHQNAVPIGVNTSICIDDRPHYEAALSWTPKECIERIRSWLNKAAKGELQDPAQPIEPLFFHVKHSIILPQSGLAQPDQIMRLNAFIQNAEGSVILTHLDEQLFKKKNHAGRIAVVPVVLPTQVMSGIRNTPSNLGELTDVLAGMGIDLLDLLRARIIAWQTEEDSGNAILSAHLAICVLGKVRDNTADREISDAKVFIADGTCVGDVGEEIGVLLKKVMEAKTGTGLYVKRLTADVSAKGRSIKTVPVNVYLDYDRVTARLFSGADDHSSTNLALVGAGAIGSHIANNLAREGSFIWSIVDKDILLPHNLVRHVLSREHVGRYKADALAEEICLLFKDHKAAAALVADVFDTVPDKQNALKGILTSAGVIIDCSASIAVARFLSDYPDATARRISAFFNPSGTATVVMAEPATRNVTLRDIEAQYYRAVLRREHLTNHLDIGAATIRYSGSCRDVTVKIPERAAASLSATASTGILNALKTSDASLTVWTKTDRGGLEIDEIAIEPIVRIDGPGWKITYDKGLIETLRKVRKTHLPNETGGVLLGIIDFAARSIHVVDALEAPSDSAESPGGFERGIVGLQEEIDKRCQKVHGQIRYVGEWHSHPKGASARPSRTDIEQLNWLFKNLQVDGCPGLMMIIGENEESVCLAEAI